MMELLLLALLCLFLLLDRTTVAVVSGYSIDEAIARYRAWNNQLPVAGDVVQEFVVRDELPQSSDDDNNKRNRRISHYAAKVAFPNTIITTNAANIACRKGLLKINGETVTSGARRVAVGDCLSLLSSSNDRRTLLPEDGERAQRFVQKRLRLVHALMNASLTHSPLKVLYEDDDMAIVCKPSGIHTMSWSGSYGKSLCLDDLLPVLLEPPSRSSTENTPLSAPLPRHRLDARVTGPVVVSKTRIAMIQLGRSFENRLVYKEYHAILVGNISVTSNHILPLASNSNNTSSSSSSSFVIDAPIDGKQSVTVVTVLGRQTPCTVDGILTDVMLIPQTGRKHQLRRHCAEILGTPILGDDLYTTTNHSMIQVRKRIGLYLYCRRLVIPHPTMIDDDSYHQQNHDTDDDDDDQQRRRRMIDVEIPEPRRFARHREKARKGYEWQLQKQQQKEEPNQ